MKFSHQLCLLILIVSLGHASHAADDDLIGKTPVSNDKSDVGEADPLNALEGRDQNNAPPVQPMPDFKEIPKSGAFADPAALPPATEAKEPVPEVPTPEIAPTPEPTPIAPPAEAAAPVPKERRSDDPDLRREGIFHKVYQKYNAQPTPVEQWDQASSAKKSEVYKIQKGDTLSDLSKTLFGDMNYWPKVWALNSDEIVNPHEIETWMQIRFFPGDLNNPPTVTVTDSAKTEEHDAPIVPAPLKRHASIVRTLPDSLPLYRFNGAANKAPFDFQIVGPKRSPASKQISLSYYISEDEIAGIGTVKETEGGLQSAGEFQYIFVETTNTTDRLFTVVREVATFKEGDADKKGPSARVIEVQGEIEVIEPVNAGKNLYRAIVRKNLAPIELGSKLLPGHLESVPTEPGPLQSLAGSVQLIGSQNLTGLRMLGSSGFVFLNGGATAGLKDGDTLGIYANLRIRNAGTAAVTNDREIGELRIIRTTPHFATAYMLSLSEDIMAGDSVGSRVSIMPAAPAATPEESSSEEVPMETGDDLTL